MPASSRSAFRHAVAARRPRSCSRATAPAALAADPKVLNIYNWSDYIADDTIKNFEKETGIKVNYDNYDTNEILHAKLVAGKTGYDIVVPGAHFAKTQIEGGLLQKLDTLQAHATGATSTRRCSSSSPTSTPATSTWSTGCGATSRSASTRPRSRPRSATCRCPTTPGA